jgi:hypothetical protein
VQIYLFNDTSPEHAGCRAVMESLGRAMAGHAVISRNKVGERFYDEQALRDCDAVLVNGEGTLHHGHGEFLLEMLGKGQELGKRTLLVNALFQQTPPFFPEVLARLDHFSVREPRSFECAKACGGNPQLMLDACAGATLQGGKAREGISGIVKGDTHPHSPLHGLLDEFPLPHAGLGENFADFIATMRNCEVYITGQHHAIYGCGLAGTPFVALPSNSHKIESLIEWSGLPIAVCGSLHDVRKQMRFAKNNPEVFKAFQAFLQSQHFFDAGDLNKVFGRTS